jgi:hypothetical protein
MGGKKRAGGEISDSLPERFGGSGMRFFMGTRGSEGARTGGAS